MIFWRTTGKQSVCVILEFFFRIMGFSALGLAVNVTGIWWCCHLCVFVVTVGGQKDFGHFVHAAQQQRKFRLNVTKIYTFSMLVKHSMRCYIFLWSSDSIVFIWLTSFTTYFSRFSTVFSFNEPCLRKWVITSWTWLHWKTWSAANDDFPVFICLCYFDCQK